MDVRIFKNAEEIGKAAAELYTELLERKPNAVLGLATGATPVPTYKNLIKLYEDGRISYYAYRDGQSVLHIVVGFDIAKNGYVIEEMRAVKTDHDNQTSQYFKDNDYPFIDTGNIDID